MTIHAQTIGPNTVVPREEFDKLIELARSSGEVDVELTDGADGDLPSHSIAQLALEGGAFDRLHDEPDVYSVGDLKTRYR